MKKEPTFKVLKPHVKDCNSVRCVKEGHWDNPWGVITRPFVTGMASGPSKRGHEQWFVMGCNVMDCDAELAVRIDHVLKNAPVGPMRKRKPPTAQSKESK